MNQSAAAVKRGTLRRIMHAACVALSLSVPLLAAGNAIAQGPPPPNDPPPSSVTNAYSAAQAAALNRGSHFLSRFTAGGWKSLNGSFFPGSNPQGGGGPDPGTLDRFRAWAEGYGQSSRTSAQGEFVGDRRTVFGGVAGIGYLVAPGAMLGFSVDQSRTDADLSTLPQSSRVDLTQFGINGAFESGSWTLAAAGIYGTGDIHSSRLDGTGFAEASYGVQVWGALAELSYQWTIGNGRIVPKGGFEWMRTETDSFLEAGGTAPVSGIAQTSERTRVFAGAELGYTHVLDHSLLDLAFTGKVINNVSQTGGLIQVSSTAGPAAPRIVQGVREGPWGFDATAVVSWLFAPGWRAYALYDGRFHDGFTSNGGTVGIEVKW